MKRELSRKAFHVASIAVPIGLWTTPRALAVPVLITAAMVAVAVEYARLYVRPVRYQFLRRTRTMLRPHERGSMSGATYMAVAYAMAALIFPKQIAVAAMLYNGLGDAAAALVGGRWGRRRTGWGKSWEGFAAALVVNVAVGLAIPGVPRAAALFGGVAGAALEFAPLPLDDNLRVVLGGGLVAWAGLLLA